jgi:protein-S-isoprenylcysteine O-methyltransferase Ste14
LTTRLRPLIGSVAFFFVAPGVVAGWLPYALSRWRFAPPFLGLQVVRWLGGALLVAGLAVLVDCFLRFALEGRGTPAPVAPTETLVVTGLYRHVRNPMYVAVLAVVLGQALLFGSVPLLAYDAVVWAAFHLFVLAYEEPTLRRQFGDSYRLYQGAVGRWWPRIEPWRGDRSS